MKRKAYIILVVIILLAGCSLAAKQDVVKGLQQVHSVFLPAVLAPYKGYFPVVINTKAEVVIPPPTNTPPLASTSYYMLTVDSTKLYNLGCEVGKLDQTLAGYRDTVVVLDFGSPVIINSQYGTDLFWYADVNLGQIASAAQNFGKGYYVCAGTDRTSHVYIGIGTTNYSTKFTTTNWREHGVAWGKMVNDVNTWFKNNGYASQVHAIGAIDIELSWNTATNSRAWVDGYDSVNLYDYYNFGTLDGCAYTYQSTYCANGWTRIDALYTSFGPLPAFPLPEIYRIDGVNARQWAMLSVFSVSYYGVPMDFVGVFTQWKACQQASPDQCIDLGLDNTPSQAWLQLYNELAKNPATAQSPRWATDIKWWDNLPFDPVPTATADVISQSSQDLAQDRINRLSAFLKTEGLSEQARKFATGKMESALRIVAERKEGSQAPASKQAKAAAIPPQTQDPVFREGIFDGMGGPIPAWEALITNHWQGKVTGGYRLVSAGSAAGDEQQGVVVVVNLTNERTFKSRQLFKAPAKTGSLRVIGAVKEGIRLEGKDGSRWLFDSASGKFTRR